MSLLALTKLSKFVAVLFDECTIETEAEAILQTLPDDKQQLIIRLKTFYILDTLFKLMEFAKTFTHHETEFLDSQVIDVCKKLSQDAHSLEDVIRLMAEDKRPRFEMLEFMSISHFTPATISHHLHLFVQYSIANENLALLEKLNDVFGVKDIYDHYNERPRPWYEYSGYETIDEEHKDKDYTIKTPEDNLVGNIILRNNCSINTIKYCLENIKRCSKHKIIKLMVRSDKSEYIKFIMNNYDWLVDILYDEGYEIQPTGIKGLFQMIIGSFIQYPNIIPLYVEHGYDIRKYSNRIILCAAEQRINPYTIPNSIPINLYIPKKLLDVLANYDITYDINHLATWHHSPAELITIVIE